MLFAPMGKDEFARTVIAGLGPGAGSATYDAEKFRIRIRGQERSDLNLANFYAEYCAAPPWKRKAVVAKCVAMGLLSPETTVPISLDKARDRLLMRVRQRFPYEETVLQSRAEGGKGAGLNYRPLAEHLALDLVYDLPNSSIGLPTTPLENWGVSFEEALEIAKKNLEEISRKSFITVRPGVFISDWHDTYDTSRMCLQDLIVNLKVKGHPVAFTPNMNVLVVTGSEDEIGLLAAASIVLDVLDKPRPMSGLAFRLGGVQWLPFLPPAEHPAYAALKSMATLALAGYYGRQKVCLDAIHAKSEPHIIAAGMAPMQSDNMVRSTAVWGQGPQTLLPEVDHLIFAEPSPGGESVAVGEAAWGRVRSIVGDLMEPMGLYPERYRTLGFPSAAQLQAMNDASLGLK